MIKKDAVLYDIMPQFCGFILNYLHHLRNLAVSNSSFGEETNQTDLGFVEFLLKEFGREGKVEFTIEGLQKVFGKDFLISEWPIVVKFLQMFMTNNFGIKPGSILAFTGIKAADTAVGFNLGIKIPIIKVSCGKEKISIKDFLEKKDKGNNSYHCVLCTTDSFSPDRRNKFVELDLLSKDKFVFNEFKLSGERVLSMVGDYKGMSSSLSTILNKYVLTNDIKKVLYQYLVLARFALSSFKDTLNTVNIDELTKSVKDLSNALGAVSSSGNIFLK